MQFFTSQLVLDMHDLFAACHKVHCVMMSRVFFMNAEDYEQLVEDIVRDGRLYASENHQEILKVSTASPPSYKCNKINEEINTFGNIKTKK